MPPEKGIGLRGLAVQYRGLIFPVLIVAAILVIIAPLPPVLMDLLLAGNITVAVVILLTTIYVKRPLEFSVFPSLLLGTTLLRLVLNVASTRLILTRAGRDGTYAAGGVIEAFGQFVTGDMIAVGLILFIILVTIQFLVITKGATRISEVAARFVLDGMPGKQMAIDADLNAGAINQHEARRRRDEVAQQADFYGAMDGASKFVRGDALAGIVITLVNIMGGLYVGMVDHAMGLGRAVEVFTKLTVGDGLVTQIPAFLISVAAGLIVTRTSADSNLPHDVAGQLVRHPEALFLASVFLLSLAITGLPVVPMLMLAAACAVTGFALLQSQSAADSDQQQPAETPTPVAKDGIEDRLLVDPLQLELGVGLIRLADAGAGGDLLDRVSQLRNRVAQELGIILPKVRICDNLRLDRRQFQIRVRDVPVFRGTVLPGALLAVDLNRAVTERRGHHDATDAAAEVEQPRDASQHPSDEVASERPSLEDASQSPSGEVANQNPSGLDASQNPSDEDELVGIPATDPISGRAARWIAPEQRRPAERSGLRLRSPAEVMTGHLHQVVSQHVAELLTRQHVHQLLGNLSKTSPQLVQELVPHSLSTAQVQAVLANLLHEGLSIRDLENILETMSRHAHRVTDSAELTEYVRQGLSKTICRQYSDSTGVLRIVRLDPSWESRIASVFRLGANGVQIERRDETLRSVLAELEQRLQPFLAEGEPAVVVCQRPAVRAGLKRLLRAGVPRAAVLSERELCPDAVVQVAATVPTQYADAFLRESVHS